MTMILGLDDKQSICASRFLEVKMAGNSGVQIVVLGSFMTDVVR